VIKHFATIMDKDKTSAHYTKKEKMLLMQLISEEKTIENNLKNKLL